MAGAGFILPRSSGKKAAKMNFSKPVNPIRNCAFGSVITALIAQPRHRVPDGNRGRDADRLTDGWGNERGLRCRRRRYRIGSVPQVLATPWGTASVETGTGARKNVHCSRANVMRPSAGLVPCCNPEERRRCPKWVQKSANPSTAGGPDDAPKATQHVYFIRVLRLSSSLAT